MTRSLHKRVESFFLELNWNFFIQIVQFYRFLLLEMRQIVTFHSAIFFLLQNQQRTNSTPKNHMHIVR